MYLVQDEFVHKTHISFFMDAAKKFKCHILVRHTGQSSLRWVGVPGVSAKRGDLKAKTADKVTKNLDISGLVCSPYLRPDAFTYDRLVKAKKIWMESKYMITDLNEVDIPLSAVITPYIIRAKNTILSEYFGCVELVNDYRKVGNIQYMQNCYQGLTKESVVRLDKPYFIHGDYDLYAIICDGKEFDPEKAEWHNEDDTTYPNPNKSDKNIVIANRVSALWRNLSIYINSRIQDAHQEYYGSIMIQHGAQVNLGGDKITHEKVLAFSPRAINGKFVQCLDDGKVEHDKYYQQIG